MNNQLLATMERLQQPIGLATPAGLPLAGLTDVSEIPCVRLGFSEGAGGEQHALAFGTDSQGCVNLCCHKIGTNEASLKLCIE